VSLSTDRGNGGGYRRTEEVLTNDQLRAELLKTAKQELAGWVRRHKMHRDLCIAVMRATGIHVNGIFADPDITLVHSRAHEGEEAA
jgi:hypothetical protein